MQDPNNPGEKYLVAIEMRSKANLQLASYYEKLIVLGAGGIAGGATISASLAIKLGKLSGINLLIEALVQMGVATAFSVFANSLAAASSIIDLHFVASEREGAGEIEAYSMQRRLRESHPFWGRLDRILLLIGKTSPGLAPRLRGVIFSTIVAAVLANGFMFYVIFVIENVLRFPH
jgi:hypothetical protein